MKKLFELLHKTEHDVLCGMNVDIKKLIIDSRKVTEGCLFVCIKGTKTDGHQYMQMAADKGAKAILVSEEMVFPKGVTIVKVNDTRIALDSIAEQFYDEPAKSLRMIGVTGTNGKTSTTYFMEQILIEHRRSVGVIGTVEQRMNQKSLNVKITTSTTPDTIELQHILSMMKAEKADDVVMEVTSHALALDKVCGIDFEVGIFTNLTQDHLDFHGSMERYIQAKAKLFQMCRHAIINVDSEAADYLLENTSAETVLTYSIESPSDLQAQNIVYTDKGIDFILNIANEQHKFYIGIPGQFSLYNALSVIGAALALQIPIDVIQRGLQNIKGVPGRIEKIESGQAFNVFVDYAHTPDGLKNILQAVRGFTTGRVIIIFGCGGDRDKTKRPIMGRVCADLADYLIVTSDNPRSEDPKAIIDEIVTGIGEAVSYECFVDRKTAIFRGVEMAQSGDSVIIAGKGHEDYQEFKNETIHFDDREVARLALCGKEGHHETDVERDCQSSKGDNRGKISGFDR